MAGRFLVYVTAGIYRVSAGHTSGDGARHVTQGRTQSAWSPSRPHSEIRRLATSASPPTPHAFRLLQRMPAAEARGSPSVTRNVGCWGDRLRTRLPSGLPAGSATGCSARAASLKSGVRSCAQRAERDDMQVRLTAGRAGARTPVLSLLACARGGRGAQRQNA